MKLKSAIGFFAHPDDETILAGGLIALLGQQGIKTHIVCATRGEGGEVGEPPLVLNRRDLGTVREAELRCAAYALGASVEVLPYVDPEVGPDDVLRAFDADFEALARQFAAIIQREEAQLVLTHGADGEYGHPAHQLVHQAVMAAAQHLVPQTLVYSVAAFVPTIEDRLWNQNEMAHYALDIRPWAAQKVAAMECHRTQHALFTRRKKQKSVRDALRTVESVRRQWPPVPEGLPDDAFAELLKQAGAWSP
ncbi:MAG: PIG-L family deacetylase [Chloroflexi bacterium]|nr:MAG: PIG-L family deacetylase [Chloroflexota bacterium]